MTNSTTKIEVILNDSFIIPTDLSIKYAVTKSTLALPNSAKLEIYNLSTKTYQKLQKEPKVEIKVNDNSIFKGKVLNPFNVYEVPNWKCEIYCNDIQQRPLKKAQYLDIKKGTPTVSAIKSITALLSSSNIDTSAFEACAKSKGSLFKQMMVEWQKEEDLIKAIQNMFKGCDTEVYKEDGVVKFHSKGSVKNALKPIIINDVIAPPTLGFADIEVAVPLRFDLKLGLGFQVNSKSVKMQTQSPYLHKEVFENKTFKITQIVHEGDNFSTDASTTQIKGLKI